MVYKNFSQNKKISLKRKTTEIESNTIKQIKKTKRILLSFKKKHKYNNIFHKLQQKPIYYQKQYKVNLLLS